MEKIKCNYASLIKTISLLLLLPFTFSTLENIDKDNIKLFYDAAKAKYKTDSFLILFYDNPCQKCRKFESVVEEAIHYLKRDKSDWAKNLLNSVTFARINGYRDSEIAYDFNVESFPSLRFIRPEYGVDKELSLIFDSKMVTSKNILDFLKKTRSRGWNVINSVEKLKEINRDSMMNLVLCGGVIENDMEPLKKMIDRAIVKYDDMELSIVPRMNDEISSSNSNDSATNTSDLINSKLSELYQYLNCSNKTTTPEIILYKKFDENEVKFIKYMSELSDGKYNSNYQNVDTINNFLSIYTKPSILEFNSSSNGCGTDNIRPFIEKHMPTLVFFYNGNQNDEINKEAYDSYYKYALKYRNSILFLKDNARTTFSHPFIDMMGISDQQLIKYPVIIAMRLIKSENNTKLSKYIFPTNTTITESSLSEFIENFTQNKLNEFLISEGDNFKNPFYHKNEEGNIISPPIYKITSNNIKVEVFNENRCFILYSYKEKKIKNEILVFLKKISKKIEELDMRVGFLNSNLNELSTLLNTGIYLINKNNDFKHLDTILSVQRIFELLNSENCFSEDYKISFSENEKDEIDLESSQLDMFNNDMEFENYMRDVDDRKIKEELEKFIVDDNGDSVGFIQGEEDGFVQSEEDGFVQSEEDGFQDLNENSEDSIIIEEKDNENNEFVREYSQDNIAIKEATLLEGEFDQEREEDSNRKSDL